eukprot:COSAG01_NODE_3700_length_5780_cov_207.494631_8_plen_86_part_00
MFCASPADVLQSDRTCHIRIGVYTWPDRTRYEGGWKNHMRDGLGIHTFADGTRYEVALKFSLLASWRAKLIVPTPPLHRGPFSKV